MIKTDVIYNHIYNIREDIKKISDIYYESKSTEDFIEKIMNSKYFILKEKNENIYTFETLLHTELIVNLKIDKIEIKGR